MRFFYNCLFLVYFFLFLPLFFLKRKKFKGHVKELLGLCLPKFHLPLAKRIIWVHATSVGEVRAIAALVKTMEEKWTDKALFVVSTTTVTGRETALKEIPNAFCHFLLPLDFSFNAKRLFKAINPEILILCEGDYWFNLFSEGKKRGVKLIIVNAKMSLRSFKRFKFFSFFSKKLFALPDLYCAQSEVMKLRLEALGAKRVVLTGNLKYDIEDKGIPDIRASFGIKGDIVTIGCTHEGEEILLLSALKNTRATLFICPRHRERLASLQKQLKENGFDFSLFSERKSDKKIVLIDDGSYLRACYQMSDLAVLAGSFTPHVGGHNILEPIFLGVPTIFGEQMWGQKEMTEEVLKSEAGIQTNIGGIASIVEKLLIDKNLQNTYKEKGLALKKSLKGSALRTFSAIEKV